MRLPRFLWTQSPGRTSRRSMSQMPTSERRSRFRPQSSRLQRQCCCRLMRCCRHHSSPSRIRFLHRCLSQLVLPPHPHQPRDSRPRSTQCCASPPTRCRQPQQTRCRLLHPRPCCCQRSRSRRRRHRCCRHPRRHTPSPPRRQMHRPSTPRLRQSCQHQRRCRCRCSRHRSRRRQPSIQTQCCRRPDAASLRQRRSRRHQHHQRSRIHRRQHRRPTPCPQRSTHRRPQQTQTSPHASTKHRQHCCQYCRRHQC